MSTGKHAVLNTELKCLEKTRDNLIGEINSINKSSDALIDDEIRWYLIELKGDLAQLELLIGSFGKQVVGAFESKRYQQSLLPGMECIPVNEDEIPF